MTIKEICGLTGKAKNTVCLWCSKIEQVNSKIEQAKKTNIPADFTLDETIEILRAGNISESLISLLKENANKKNMIVKSDSNINNLEKMFISFMQQQQKTNEILLSLVSNKKELSAPAEKEKISVETYCRKNNIRPYSYHNFFRNVGKRCSELSKQLQRSVKYQKEGNWDVGLYDIDIVKNCVENELLAIERTKNLFLGVAK